MNMIINYHYCLEMRNDFMMASLISRPQTHFPPPPTLSTTIFSALHSPSLLPFPLCFPYLLFIALLSSPLLISSLPVLPSLLFSFLFFSSLLFSSLVWYSSSTLVFRYHFFSVLPLSHHFPSFTPLHLPLFKSSFSISQPNPTTVLSPLRESTRALRSSLSTTMPSPSS